MGKLWDTITAWLDEVRCEMGMLAIEKRYRDAGRTDWFTAAREEVSIRANYIERFRDEASRQFLKGVPLREYKETFIRQNLTARTTIYDSATTAKIRNIIRAMPEVEAFHGEALAKHRREFNAWLKEMNDLNKKRHGPSGLDERTRRVLRAGA